MVGTYCVSYQTESGLRFSDADGDIRKTVKSVEKKLESTKRLDVGASVFLHKLRRDAFACESDRCR